MAKSAADLINILRNITGRVDASDPLFTDEIMLQYLQDFIQLLSTQDVRLYKNHTWYEFTLEEDEDTVDINLQEIELVNGQVGASTIGPLCYAAGFPVFWYENPGQFYGIWPETQEYQLQRPTYVLYYNNQLVFRGPADQNYLIKVQAYQVEIQITNGVLNQDYLFRYICYGAALDIFSDFGEMDRWRDIFPVFQRYRALVYSRTYSQYQSQRSIPEF